MKDENSKAKLLTIGIAVVLILMIAGISLVIHAINKRDSEDTSSKLQSDIMEYADNGQENGVTAQEMEKEPEEEDAAAAENVTEEKAETEDETAEKEDTDPAVVVEKQEQEAEESIMEEEHRKQEENAGEQKTTAKWQKDANENLVAVEIDLPRQMSEMKNYWEQGNMKAVEDLAYLPRYRAASEKLSGTTKYYYFGDTDGENRPNGIGLAMYTDNQYYYGSWENGVRSGDGMWIKFYVYDQNAKAKDSIYLQHSYSGMWSGDLPNGDGAEHYDFIDGNLEPNVGYNRNFIGKFKDGLYNGEIYITDYYSDGNSKEWSGQATEGEWHPMGEKDKKGQYPIIVELTNQENYQWMNEKVNKNNGIKGLISAAK